MILCLESRSQGALRSEEKKRSDLYDREYNGDRDTSLSASSPVRGVRFSAALESPGYAPASPYDASKHDDNDSLALSGSMDTAN